MERILSHPRTLVLAGLVLAVVQAIEGIGLPGRAKYLSVLLFIASLVGVAAVWKMRRDNCFESCFMLAMVAASAIVGHMLLLTAGLPGSEADAWSGGQAAFGSIALVTASFVLVMLLIRWFRLLYRPVVKPPYDS